MARKGGVYVFGQFLATVIVHTIFPTRYEHLERLRQQEAPYILICNHLSNVDVLILGSAVRKEPIHFLGKQELANNRFMRWLTGQIHMIPVNRHATDMEAMRACNRVLKEGGILGIFPEGTRHHEGLMQETETGTAYIALRNRVPMVPVWIHRKPRLFRVTRVTVGEPIPQEDLWAEGMSSDTAQRLMDRIAQTYADMAEAAEK